MTEDEMVGWHHRLNGHEFEQTQGDSEGQGGLVCCRLCGHKELDSFLVAQLVKTLPAMQETWVRSLGWEDPLEGEMATHSSIPAWRIPWTEEPGRLQSMESQRVRHD